MLTTEKNIASWQAEPLSVPPVLFLIITQQGINNE